MSKFYDENGAEVEGFTAAELEAQKKSAADEVTKANATKDGELKKANDAIAELNKKLEEAGLSDAQKKRLKEGKELAEEALKQVSEKFTKEISDLKTSLYGNHRNRLITAVAKDEETRKKVQAKYDSLIKSGDYVQDEEGITKAVTDAATLVMGNKPTPGFLDGITGAGNRGNNQEIKSGTVETDAGKAQRKLLGISDEEATKFAPKSKV